MTTNENKKIVFTLRMNTKLLEKIRTLAEKNKRSAAGQIEFMLEQSLNKYNH